MKSVILSALTAASMLFSGPVFSAEEDIMDLLKRNNCLGCHRVDSKRVGPTFRQISKKYRNDPNVAAVLEKKIVTGGNGVWGTMPMPEFQNRITHEDMKAMITFILSLE